MTTSNSIVLIGVAALFLPAPDAGLNAAEFVLNGALEPEELAIVQKALDRIAEAFTT